MRNFYLLFIFVTLLSCGSEEKTKNPETNILSGLSYAVDTVVVDSGGELINLAYGFMGTAISKDGKMLYFMDQQSALLHEIDLDKMARVHSVHFEKEGPNGIGSFVPNIQVISSELFVFQGFETPGIFNRQGEKELSLKIEPEGLDPGFSTNSFALIGTMALSQDSNTMYSIPSTFASDKRDLVRIDLAANQATLIELPEFHEADNFRLNFLTGRPPSVHSESFSIKEMDGKIFITCGYRSGVYRYDPDADHLEFTDIQHSITQNKKSGEFINNPASSEEWWSEYRKVVAQTSYHELYWIPAQDIFLRLGKKVKVGETKQDPSTSEVFLYAYDRELNVLGETRIEGLKAFPSNYFFKDSKLYSYVNVDDELGFSVFTFDF